MSETRKMQGSPASGRKPQGPPIGPGGPGPGRRPVEKAKDFKGSLKRLLTYLKPFKLQIVFILILAVLSSVFGIFAPKLMGEATTEIFGGIMTDAGVNFSRIARILVTLGTLYVFSAAFSYLQQYLMADTSQKTVRDLRREISEKLNKLPLKYFDGRTHGEVLSRVINDVDTISSTLQQSITQALSSLITLVGTLVMMLTISPTMTLLALISLPLALMVTKFIIPRSQKYFVLQQRILGELNGHIEEAFGAHKIVKAYSNEQKAIDEFEEINEKLYDTGWKAQFISGIIRPIMGFVNNVGYVIICIVGSVMVTKGRIKIGDIQAFLQYSRQFTHPIVGAADIINILQSTVASAERVFEILDEEEEVPDSPEAVEPKDVEGNVRFEHVTFSYEVDKPLIEDLNIDVKSGQTVAIVGPTGAGKTTLVNLLMRFYELRGGRITIDGVDIKEMSRSGLRRVFGMVLQDTWLFNGTILDNIAYGREGATEEEIVQAAVAARADHFIRTLPEGYDTVLNEEASNLSQGQKQLLTIARAILADPAILILDEATSSVDTRTEVQIQKAMKTLMEGRTNFVIAHRLSTILDADVILVMNHGQIIEKGTHKELLEKNGFYAELYNSQFTASQAAV